MKIMAVDYGDARTGLAVCDRTEFLASPIGTVQERNAQILAMKVAHMAEQYEVGEIVIGLPLNMNGSEGPRAQKCRLFAETVECVTELPVKLWTSARLPYPRTAYSMKPMSAAKTAKTWWIPYPPC